MRLIRAEFRVSALCNYQNFELVLCTDNRRIDEYNIVLQYNTPIQNTDNKNVTYSSFQAYDYYSRTENQDNTYNFTYLLDGIESVPNWNIRIKEGSPMDPSSPVVVRRTWSGVFLSGIYCNIWVADDSNAAVSNMISDVPTPDVHMFRENFESYAGMECTQVGDNGGDNFYKTADGVYFPIIKNQTFVPFSFCEGMSVDDTQFSINSCVACAVSSGMESINYKMTGSIKIYSTGYIYGAATEDSGNKRYNVNGRENIIDLAGMYFNDAKEACVNYGCPPVEAIPYNRYDGQYTWSPNDSFPCIKFEQEYTDPITGTNSFVKRVNAGLVYATMKNTAQGRDRLTNLFQISADKESIKECIKSKNNAVIVLSKKVLEYDSNGFAASTPQQNANHAMLIIGWITIKGIFYWVCHNSWGKGEGDNGKIYLPFGHASIGAYYMLSGFIKGRPQNWSWYTVIGREQESFRRVHLGQENEIKSAMLSAREWIDFCGRINEFRIYKGLTRYSFTKPSIGDVFSAEGFNEALAAISEITNEVLPAMKHEKDCVSAEDLFCLRNILNNIK